MLGIPDPWAWLAYVLCFLSALACVFYRWRNWLMFIMTPECTVTSLVKARLLAHAPNWPAADPLFIGLPLSALTAWLLTLATAPADAAHLDRCFGSARTTGRN